MNTLREFFIGLTLTAAMAATTHASAAVLTLEPVGGIVQSGAAIVVDLKISGLGDGSAPSLGAFDVDIGFDTALASFTGAVFGDPLLGDQLDLFGFGSLTFLAPASGTVNLAEISLDLANDLDLLQASAFTLARLTFDSLAAGSAVFGLSVNDVSDSSGEALSVSTQSATVLISERPVQVPEPGVLWLAVYALAMLTVFGPRSSQCPELVGA